MGAIGAQPVIGIANNATNKTTSRLACIIAVQTTDTPSAFR